MNYNYFKKSVSFFGIIIFAVFQNSNAIDVEKNLTPEASTNATSSTQGSNSQDVGCGIYHLNSSLSLKIQNPFFQKEDNSSGSTHECTWEFYGAEECNPEITCENFDLLETKSCDNEFLELDDASGGSAKFCGTIAPNVVSSSSILIVTFKTEVANLDKGFHCKIACSTPDRIKSLDTLSSTRKSKGKAVQVCKAGNRIVGGQPTTIEVVPYQVSLQYFGSHICGASIISSNRILTAAHCTTGQSASSLSIRIKSTYRGSGGEVIKVRSICQHPGYNARTLDNDVSVLRLTSTITFDAAAQSICIPSIGSGPKIPVGTLGTVSGWGTLSAGGSLPTQLQKVDVPRVSQQDCKSAYGLSAITDNMICFGYEQGGKDSCQGDSGGPMVIKNTQVGVVSWGVGCAAPRNPGVYADLSAAGIQNHILSC